MALHAFNGPRLPLRALKAPAIDVAFQRALVGDCRGQ